MLVLNVLMSVCIKYEIKKYELGEGNLISCSTDPTDPEFRKIKKIIILIF